MIKQSKSAEKWGVLEDGTNQGVKHFVDYWEKYPERIPSLEQRLGVNIGYEVEMLIDNDEETCWKICFSSCYKVLYETDANRRNITKVRDMRKSQLGYFGQDISAFESENANFYKVDLDLSIMEIVK